MAKFRLENGFRGPMPSQLILAGTLLEGEIKRDDQLIFDGDINVSIVDVEIHYIQDFKKMILTVWDNGEVVWHKHYGKVLLVKIIS